MMGGGTKSVRRLPDLLTELEKFVQTKGGKQVVGCEVLLEDRFKRLEIRRLAQKFPSLLIRLSVDPNPWVEEATLSLRNDAVVMRVAGSKVATGFVSKRELFIELAKISSSHDFQPVKLDEQKLILRKKVTRRELIGPLVEEAKRSLEKALKNAGRLEMSREQKVRRLRERIGMLDGTRLGSVHTTSVLVKMLLSSVYPELAAYLVLAIEPRYEKPVCDALLTSMGIDDMRLERLIHDAWTFGLIEVTQQGITLTQAGKFLQSLLFRILEGSGRLPETKIGIWKYRIQNVMNYVFLKFPKKLAKISKKMSENVEALKKIGRLVEENITFTDVLACFFIYKGLAYPGWLGKESLQKLIALGMLSWRAKIRPFGKALAMCFEDYLKDAEIIDEGRYLTLEGWSKILALN
jgi:hypothetical protein